MKIEAASQERADELLPWIKQITNAMGIEAAFITDESCISDFRPGIGKDLLSQKENNNWLRLLSHSIGTKVSMHDTLVDVALKLKDK